MGKKHDKKHNGMISTWLKNEKEENPEKFTILSDLSDEALLEFVKLRQLPPLSFHDFWQCNHSKILNEIMNSAWNWSAEMPDPEKITRNQLMFLALVWSN